MIGKGVGWEIQAMAVSMKSNAVRYDAGLDH